jgi:hypothetical protein
MSVVILVAGQEEEAAVHGAPVSTVLLAWI